MSCSDTGLISDMTYYYRVYAYQGEAVFASSNIANARTQRAIDPTLFSYYLCDHLGNTRVVVAKDENDEVYVKESYDYYPFGKILPGRS